MIYCSRLTLTDAPAAREINLEAGRQHRLIVAALPQSGGDPPPFLFRRDGNHYVVLTGAEPDWRRCFFYRPGVVAGTPEVTVFEPTDYPAGQRLLLSYRCFPCRRQRHKMLPPVWEEKSLLTLLTERLNRLEGGWGFEVPTGARFRVAATGRFRLETEPRLENLDPETASPAQLRAAVKKVLRGRVRGRVTMPFADVSLEVVVTDPAGFRTTLYPRGLGRHTTWGYGLVAARPL